jgi:hypothetical protein
MDHLIVINDDSVMIIRITQDTKHGFTRPLDLDVSTLTNVSGENKRPFSSRRRFDDSPDYGPFRLFSFPRYTSAFRREEKKIETR